MEHLAQETLSALLDGEIDREEAFAAEAHLRECADCRGSLETLRRTAALLGRLERVACPDHVVDDQEERIGRRVVLRGPERWWRLTALPRPLLLSTAASVILLVCLAYAASHLGLWKGLEGPAPAVPPQERVGYGPALEGEAREETADGKDAEAGPAPAARLEAPAPSVGKKSHQAWGPVTDGDEAPETRRRREERWAPAPEEPLRDEERVEQAEGLVTRETGIRFGEGLTEEDRLAREDRQVGKAVEKGRRAAAPRAPGRALDSAVAAPAVGEAVVSLTDAGGRVLGELRMVFGRLPVGERLGGIRIHCDPEEGAGYGNERNPIEEERRPEGFVWPAFEEGPETWSIVKAEEFAARPGGREREGAKKGTAVEEEKLMAYVRRPPAAPPGLAFSLEGEVLVDRYGRPVPSGVPPWLLGPMSEVRFEAGRCIDGRPAAALVPYRVEWTPAE